MGPCTTKYDGGPFQAVQIFCPAVKILFGARELIFEELSERKMVHLLCGHANKYFNHWTPRLLDWLSSG